MITPCHKEAKWAVFKTVNYFPNVYKRKVFFAG